MEHICDNAGEQPQSTTTTIRTVSMYLHDFSDVPSLASYEQFAQMLVQSDIPILRAKAGQGGKVQGTWDKSPLAFHTVEELAAAFLTFQANGVQLIPWYVPQGNTVAADKALCLQIAQACGNIIELDIEVGSDFWNTAKYGTAGIVELIEFLSTNGVTVEFDTDMRAASADEMPIEQVLPFVFRWLSQSYWTDFKEDAVSVVNKAVAYMKSRGIANFAIIVPADSSAQDLQRTTPVLTGSGAAEVALWDWQIATAADFTYLKNLPRSG